MTADEQLAKALGAVAREQIEKRGRFSALAGVVDARGELRIDALDVALEPDALHDALVALLRERARQREIVASAICMQAIIDCDEGQSYDAISLEVETADGRAKRRLTPWRKPLLRRVRFGRDIVEDGEPQVFPGRELCA